MQDFAQILSMYQESMQAKAKKQSMVTDRSHNFFRNDSNPSFL